MVLRGSGKCLSIFFIIFLMCPKRTRLSVPLKKQPVYYQAVRKSLNEVNNGDSENSQNPRLPMSIVKESATFLNLGEEVGYKFTDLQMKQFRIWPKGIIPYFIDPISFHDAVLRDTIRTFLNEVNALTKITFIQLSSPPKDEKVRWVFFINRQGHLGCGEHYVWNFTNEGVQRVVLGYDCIATHGELADAVLAIAGVPPQHVAPNRNKYIKVLYDNVEPEKKYLFRRLKSRWWLFQDVKYDFASAGHFHNHKYTKNGRATIETRKPYSGIILGQNNLFTLSDIKKLEMLYNYIGLKAGHGVTDCAKLFRKGHNFTLNLKHTVSKVKPRRPIQYLGLPEKYSVELYEDSEEKSDDKDEEEEEEKEDTEHEKPKESEEIEIRKEFERNRNSKNTNYKNRTVLLAYFSDSQTHENNIRNDRKEKNTEANK